jgi:PAS domain S-box-containing protein
MQGDDLTAEVARSRLYEIMRGDGSFDSKATAALELGTAYLGVEHAHVAQIDPETDYWEAIHSTDTEDGLYPVGLVGDLERTYCRRTITEDTSLAIHDVTAQGWANDPAFETHGLECYHGTTINLREDTYGTVCFVSKDRREPFTADETMFAELIARTLEQQLERRAHSAAQARQTNLINVLNRVLRHNLRNSMAVIRGRTAHIAEQYPEAGGTQTILDHCDRLIDLSHKARTLESVIIEEFDRERESLQSILTTVRDSVTDEFQSATVSVECDAELTVAVRPSFATALYELIENAAKHAGSSPEVSVSVVQIPNAIRIQIADNGPGLANTEQEVLTEGVERPLSHGSGLGIWMAYWIVTSHDGTIEAAVTSDGTSLTVEVPNTSPSDQDVLTEHEQTLTRVHDKFRSVFEESSEAMLIADDDGQYLEVNQRAGELFGVAPANLLGRSIDEFLPDSVDFDSAWQAFQETDRMSGTIPLVRPDGTERIAEYTARRNIVPGQHLSILRDVTEREQRKQDLELADTVFENVQDAVFLIDVESDGTFRVQRVNERYEQLTGLSKDEIVGKTPIEIVGEEFGGTIEARYQRCVDKQETIVYPEAIPVDGEPRQWETKLTPLLDDGEVMKLVGAMRDVTEREERKTELKRYERILQTITDPVWVYDTEKTVTFANRELTAELPMSHEEIVDQPLEAFVEFFADPEVAAKWERLVDDVLTGEQSAGELTCTFMLPTRQVRSNVRVTPLTDGDAIVGAVVVARELSSEPPSRQ